MDAVVQPEYYGLEMFARGSPPPPPGARLLDTVVSSVAAVRAWATRAPDRTLRVVLINDGTSRRAIAVRAAGTGPSATFEQLLAPSIGAQSAITLGGQSFGRVTSTGLLAGRQRLTVVAPIHGDFVVSMPATSAAMLTFARR